MRAPPSAATDAGAVSWLERAVRLDPDFAPAWAALARAHARAHYMGFDRTAERAARAREAAETATRVAPGSADAHLALGYVVYWVHHDLGRALEEMEAAERLRPGDAEVLSGTGLGSGARGGTRRLWTGSSGRSGSALGRPGSRSR